MKTNHSNENMMKIHYPLRPLWNSIVAALMLLIIFSSEMMISAQSSQSPTQTVCTGTEPYLVTNTPGSNYVWSVTPGTSGTNWQVHGTGNSITVDWLIAGSYTLSVTETNSLGCSGSPKTLLVTVVPTPDVINPANQTVSNGAAVAAINFTGTVSGTVFNWTNDTPSIGLAASGTGNIATFTAINNGSTPVTATITVTPVYTNSGATCSGTSSSFTIIVNPSTTMNPVPDASYCSGSVTSPILFSSSLGGTTYTWTNSNTSIGLAASGSGNIPSFTAVNNGTVAVVATLTVTPSRNGQTGNPVSFTITINPLPSTSPIFHN
jgi:hypothetical protein